MHHHRLVSAQHRWPRLTLLLLLAVLPTLLPAAQTSLAQSNWPVPVRVNLDTSQSGNEPAIDYDPQGFAHVVWYGGTSNDAWAIYYTNNRANGAWAPQRLISSGGKSDERKPDIVVAPNGSVHVAWERRKGNSEIYYTTSPDLGATWGVPSNVSNNSQPQYEPTIAADNNSNVHIAWIDRRFSSDADDSTVVISRIGGAFGPQTRVSNFDDRSPSITATGGGTNVLVHVVWYGRPTEATDNGSYEIFYGRGAPNGQYSVSNITNDSGIWSLDPSIASDGANGLYVVWDKQTGGKHQPYLIYSNNAGSSWSEPRSLDPTTVEGVFPAVDYGNAAGGGSVHIAWGDKRNSDTQKEVLYVLYNPATNTFGSALERVSQQASFSERPRPAANPAHNNFGIAFQSRNGTGFLKSFVSQRTGSPIPPPPDSVGGSMTIAPPGNGPTITVTLSNLTGTPTEMNVSFDGPPTNASGWEPIQTSFTRTIPALATNLCDRSIQVQLRNANSNTSPILVGEFQQDRAVQALVKIQNPNYTENADDFTSPVAIQDIDDGEGASNGHPYYTRQRSFYLEVGNLGECSSLGDATVTGFSGTVAVPDTGYAGLQPLPDSSTEGPRTVSVRLTDSASNEMMATQTITRDITAPQFVSGSISAPDVPSEGATTSFVRLQFASVSVTDNLYPSGMWGVWVANTLDSTILDNDPRLDWRAIPVADAAGGSFSINRWNVAIGIANSVLDLPTGRDIQVRVRFLDGAGNPTTAESLRTTVRLAGTARGPTAYLPLVHR